MPGITSIFLRCSPTSELPNPPPPRVMSMPASPGAATLPNVGLGM